jgi:hypothetical protein
LACQGAGTDVTQTTEKVVWSSSVTDIAEGFLCARRRLFIATEVGEALGKGWGKEKTKMWPF